MEKTNLTILDLIIVYFLHNMPKIPDFFFLGLRFLIFCIQVLADKESHNDNQVELSEHSREGSQRPGKGSDWQDIAVSKSCKCYKSIVYKGGKLMCCIA